MRFKLFYVIPVISVLVGCSPFCANNKDKLLQVSSQEECWAMSNTHIESRQCLFDKLNKTNEKMDLEYKNVVLKMQEFDEKINSFLKDKSLGAEKALKKSQEDFIDYRESNCKWYYKHAGPGNWGSDNQLDCEINMTNQRIKELQTIAEKEFY